MSRNIHYLAVFDDPGRIFPAFFDGPGFVIVSGVCEISIDASGLITGPEVIGGKMKDALLIALSSGTSVSAIYESGLSKVYRSIHTSRMTSTSSHNGKGRVN
jgi:hypothetical protein